ncbi:MAG TPA: LON peptidase substrate-binding domain-containing protein [Polyangiaceae bacterium]|nr:LON peptidase substrate-binding domain-containing protein [Polyangiaceae bacterium]
MTAPKYDLSRALGELPLFPLPRMVLFPGTELPLHVFEPRYRRMLADCLETHGAMAVVRLLEPERNDGRGQSRICSVAGAGIVTHHEKMADGRSNLILAASARVHLEELPFIPPYRRARARVLRTSGGPVREPDAAALVGAATAFALEVRRHDPEFSFHVPDSLSPGAIADVCAAHLIVDADVRQLLLEELDDAKRVQIVIEELASQRLRIGNKSRVLH